MRGNIRLPFRRFRSPSGPRSRGIGESPWWRTGGSGWRRQKDLIQTSGYFVDLAKIVVALSRILPQDVLVKKISSTKKTGSSPFPAASSWKLPSCRKESRIIAGRRGGLGFGPSRFPTMPSRCLPGKKAGSSRKPSIPVCGSSGRWARKSPRPICRI